MPASRLRRLLIVAALAALLTTSGCTAYPDGVVARRADGYVVRSHCPAGSLPQVVSVEVSVLPSRPHSKPKPIWAAHAKGKAVSEIRLFESADDIDVTLDSVPELSSATELNVDVVTVQALWGGGTFHWNELEVGQAISMGTITQEADLAAPGWTTSIRCDDRPTLLDRIAHSIDMAMTWTPITMGGIAIVLAAAFLIRRRSQR